MQFNSLFAVEEAMRIAQSRIEEVVSEVAAEHAAQSAAEMAAKREIELAEMQARQIKAEERKEAAFKAGLDSRRAVENSAQRGVAAAEKNLKLAKAIASNEEEAISAMDSCIYILGLLKKVKTQWETALELADKGKDTDDIQCICEAAANDLGERMEYAHQEWANTINNSLIVTEAKTLVRKAEKVKAAATAEVKYWISMGKVARGGIQTSATWTLADKVIA
jgi:hypothetical protein